MENSRSSSNETLHPQTLISKKESLERKIVCFRRYVSEGIEHHCIERIELKEKNDSS